MPWRFSWPSSSRSTDHWCRLRSIGDRPKAGPWRTIERIVKRAGRSKPRRRESRRYELKGTPYPARPNRVGPGLLHEIDPVGARYLDGAQEVHSLNVMDVGSHRVALKPGGRARIIREQIIEDHELTLWVRESPSGFVLTVVSPHLEFGNRDFAFTEDGANYAVGSAVDGACRPSWIFEVP